MVELSNMELLHSISNDETTDNYGDGSKARRHIHLQLGPIVISGAAIDRVRARFVSL